jgi:hypothetical protein
LALKLLEKSAEKIWERALLSVFWRVGQFALLATALNLTHSSFPTAVASQKMANG